MGAGHCQWGGFTDRSVYNIHGEEHPAVRPLGTAGTGVTDARKEEGRKARKYIMMCIGRF